VWILSRYDDVSAALADWRTFSSVASMADLRAAPGARSADGEQLITTDPPSHDALRGVVREYFSPKRIQAMEAEITREAVTRAARLRSPTSVDVAREFAWPFALAIISDMLGIPAEHRSTVLSWYLDLEYRPLADDAADKLANYTDFFRELAEARLSDPRDDLMSELMRAVTRGEIARPDAVMLCKDLFEGGVDVPANVLANSMLALAEHPDQRRYLLDGQSDTARLRLGVEELARYDPPIQRIPRITTTSVTIHDTLIPKDATVLLLLGSANHDERRFADPETLNVARPATRNVAFGAGVHFCIGAPLARLEARIALVELLTALPEYEVMTPVQRPRASHVMRALLNLEVTAITAAARMAGRDEG
jgi:cytochrome P450